MQKYVLKWSKLGKVKDIYPIIRERQVSVSDERYPQLKEPGVYLFLDLSLHNARISHAPDSNA